MREHDNYRFIIFMFVYIHICLYKAETVDYTKEEINDGRKTLVERISHEN